MTAQDVQLLKLHFGRDTAGRWSISDMSSLTLKARDASAEAFFAIDDDLVLSQPATFGTTTHFLRQSIVPIVAHVQGENVLRCLGTGFFISCSGLLVTAAHVVTDPIERQYGGLNELDGLTWHTDELHLGVLLTTGANLPRY